MKTLIESITEEIFVFPLGLEDYGGSIVTRTVRVWREEETGSFPERWATQKLVHEEGNAIIKRGIIELTDWATEFLKVDKVNAVEIKEGNKCGVVFYKDWP